MGHLAPRQGRYRAHASILDWLRARHIRSASGSLHSRCRPVRSCPAGTPSSPSPAETESSNTSCPTGCNRSEEHTSELQSLMRISYAVFCLKKKKTNHITNNINSKRKYHLYHK